VFYGDLGIKSENVKGWDLDAREHLAMWPLVILFLIMGVSSPIWLRAIDAAGTRIAATQSSSVQPQAQISTASASTEAK
jgi:NADH-quinone oxidoreductase subunit M